MSEPVQVISRKQARSEGLIFYYTGKPCCRGHIGLRYTKSKVCLECKVAWTKENLDSKVRGYQQRSRARHREKRNSNKRKYHTRKRTQLLEKQAAWRESNRERLRQADRERAQRHPEKIREKSSRRRAVYKRATPSWVDKELLWTIYRNCPNGFQVDHIIPLRGKNVCGLHVPWNLQYLTPEENNSKSNRFVAVR